jgi:hypothetical protein
MKPRRDHAIQTVTLGNATIPGLASWLRLRPPPHNHALGQGEAVGLGRARISVEHLGRSCGDPLASQASSQWKQRPPDSMFHVKHRGSGPAPRRPHRVAESFVEVRRDHVAKGSRATARRHHWSCSLGCVQEVPTAGRGDELRFHRLNLHQDRGHVAAPEHRRLDLSPAGTRESCLGVTPKSLSKACLVTQGGGHLPKRPICLGTHLPRSRTLSPAASTPKPIHAGWRWMWVAIASRRRVRALGGGLRREAASRTDSSRAIPRASIRPRLRDPGRPRTDGTRSDFWSGWSKTGRNRLPREA